MGPSSLGPEHADGHRPQWSILRYSSSVYCGIAIRDLRVYAQAARAEVRYYRDSKNLEVDAIVTRGAGDWAAVEVKLGGTDAIASAVESLRRVRSKVDTQQAGEPTRLIVLTAVGRAFETVDDIAVVPVTLLGP